MGRLRPASQTPTSPPKLNEKCNTKAYARACACGSAAQGTVWRIQTRALGLLGLICLKRTPAFWPAVCWGQPLPLCRPPFRPRRAGQQPAACLAHQQRSPVRKCGWSHWFDISPTGLRPTVGACPPSAPVRTGSLLVPYGSFAAILATSRVAAW